MKEILIVKNLCLMDMVLLNIPITHFTKVNGKMDNFMVKEFLHGVTDPSIKDNTIMVRNMVMVLLPMHHQEKDTKGNGMKVGNKEKAPYMMKIQLQSKKDIGQMVNIPQYKNDEL